MENLIKIQSVVVLRLLLNAMRYKRGITTDTTSRSFHLFLNSSALLS